MNNVTADSARSAERLTGKQRVLRGLKYFLGMFAVVFVLVASSATIMPERDIWSVRAAVAAVSAVPAAVLAGLIVMAFPRRRLWHGIFAVVVALVACGLFM
jgi:hypothetical protein